MTSTSSNKELVFGNLVKASKGIGFLNENNLITDYRDMTSWTPQVSLGIDNPEEATYTIVSSACFYKKIGTWVKLLINIEVDVTVDGTIIVMSNLPSTPNKGSNNGNLVSAITTGDPLGQAQATILAQPLYEDFNGLVFEGNFVVTDPTTLVLQGEMVYQSNNLSQF